MRTIEQIKESEYARLSSVHQRLGLEATIAFAKQGYAVYRAQLKMRPCKYGKSYREELVVSCMVYRQYLRTVNKFDIKTNSL